MMHAARRIVASAMTIAFAVTALPAAASARDESEELNALLSRVVPEVLDGLRKPGGPLRSLQGPTAAVPTAPGQPVSVHGEDGTTVSIDLPEATGAESNAIGGLPVTTFEHDDARTVPLPKDDGSVQILTVLDNSSAPESFTYQLKLPTGWVIRQEGDGSIAFVDADGMFSGGVAPAWAKDAKGILVPTRYELSGTTLTQIVEHVGQNFTYPIVADPWLGKDLYGKPSIAHTKNDKKYKGYSIVVRPTKWGIANSALAKLWAHRDEVKSKLGKNKTKWTNSIQEQFYCHIAMLPASLMRDPNYNLESWRPTVNWAAQMPRCNPPRK